MNKKLLLLTLPAIMVLSSCTALKANVKGNILMAEDNLAHEEIFGEAVEAGELGLKLAAPYKLDALTSDFVKMGYQIAYKSADDTLSIRFVAAVKDAGVTAFWHRGIAQPNGYEGAEVTTGNWKFKFEEYTTDTTGKESTKLYSSLTDGTNTLSAGPTGTEGWTQYAGFAIYTVTGIPYTTYKDSYFAAYVNLADASSPSNKIKSQALAVKIEKDGTASKNKFFFDPNTYGHFLEGTINDALYDGGANGLYRESANIPDGNYAWYENVPLKTTDSFGSFYYGIDNQSKHHFQFFGAHDFFAESAGFFEKASLSGYCKPILQGSYDLKISAGNANHVYTEAKSYAKSLDAIKSEYPDLYLVPGVWETNDPVARFAVNLFGGTGTWVSMAKETVNGKVVYKCTLDASALTNTSIIFCRMNGGTVENNWDNKWNQTSDLTFSDRIYKSGPLGVCSITAAGDGNQTWVGVGGCSDINL